MAAEITAPKRHGLAVLWDMLVDPGAAFADLRVRPYWGWAFLVTCVLGMVGAYLQVPAGQHVAAAMFAHDPKFATMSPEQVANASRIAGTIQRFTWLFYPILAIVAIAFASVIYLVANAIGKGSARFANLFGLAANIAILNFGIAYLLIGVIAALRGPDNFTTQSDLIGLLPSLGWLVPAGSTKLHVFLAAFNPFQIWSVILIALGLRSIAGISAALAWGTGIVLGLAGAAIGAAAVH